MVFLQIGENDICQQYSASHTASEIIQLAKYIRRMGVSTVVIGSNIIRPTPRNMKETTYADAVCDAEYCWQMSFSPICRNTMSHSGSKFFTT
jgi:hypothetical protein